MAVIAGDDLASRRRPSIIVRKGQKLNLGDEFF
jgi:hypothetical protein